MPSEKKYNCLACQDTKKDSKGNDCFPCSINRRIERPDNRLTYSHEPTIRKEKSKLKQKIPRKLPPLR